MKTSDLFTEEERCTISDLPNPWCACWVCRPDEAEGIPGHPDNEGNR